jgi:glycosyltransferase involved in cell wall biosynthesis
LRRLDVDARVVALKDRRREVFPWRVAVRPAVYDGTDDASHRTTETDIIVATHWRTVGLARSMVDRGRAARAAYFVQDYEPWFHDERDSEARARVRATYESISHRIVTSEWLRGLLENDGFDAVTIPLGVDLGFFYPRAHGDRPIVLAMARPRTPRRGFETLVAALTRVHEATPGAEIVLFGEDLRDVPVPFPYTAAGVVTDREELAVLYSSARVLVDVSDFQAFGLPTLEAMACGTVCVATDVGGVHEYARDRENCLLVPARDPDAAADAVVRLLTDDALHRRLRDGALEGSARHSIVRVAQDMLQAFEKIKASPA